MDLIPQAENHSASNYRFQDLWCNCSACRRSLQKRLEQARNTSAPAQPRDTFPAHTPRPAPGDFQPAPLQKDTTTAEHTLANRQMLVISGEW